MFWNRNLLRSSIVSNFISKWRRNKPRKRNWEVVVWPDGRDFSIILFFKEHSINFRDNFKNHVREWQMLKQLRESLNLVKFTPEACRKSHHEMCQKSFLKGILLALLLKNIFGFFFVNVVTCLKDATFRNYCSLALYIHSGSCHTLDFSKENRM